MKNLVHYLPLLAMFFLISCGGGGSNSEPDSPEGITISGLVVDDPITDSTVILSDLSGNKIDSTTTDVNGEYSFNLQSQDVSDGFLLEASGGQMNGIDFVGTMKAIYSPSDSKTDANITPITTFIHKLTEQSGGISIQNRNNAIQKATSLGLIKDQEFFKIDGEYTNEEVIQQMILDKGMSVWIDELIEDMNDDEIRSSMMAAFPKANGGIEKISILPSSNISLFPGKNKQLSIEVQSDSDSILTGENLPPWVSIDDNLLNLSPTSDTEKKTYSLSISATASGIAKGKKKTITVTILDSVLLLSGQLGIAGGRLENEWKDIIISVEPNQLSQNYDVSYYAGLDEQGKLYLQFKTVPEMPVDERLKVKIAKPNPEAIIQNYLSNQDNQTSQRVRFATTPKSATVANRAATSNQAIVAPLVATDCRFDWIDENEDGHSFDYIWSGDFSYFNDLPFYQVNGYPRVQPGIEQTSLDTVSQCSSALRSSVKWDDDVLRNTDYEPVLLVHGFISSGELGGLHVDYDTFNADDHEEYFGAFPKAINDLNISGRRFIPFLFQWRTNARFQDVASELGYAIKKISEKTGKQVHIVSHSFGGLLTRTLVQGLATNTQFNNEFSQQHIATITTVGTPHSGIFGTGVNKDIEFDSEGVETFPHGTDGVAGRAIRVCKAIACYQAGEDWNEMHRSYSSTIYGTRNNGPDGGSDTYLKAPGYIVYKLSKGLNDYPGIPTQVLMGVVPAGVGCKKSSPNSCKVEYLIDSALTDHPGDGLISLKGQRIKPDLEYQSVYLSNYVEEHILNFNTKNFIKGSIDNIVLEVASGLNVLGGGIVYNDPLEVEFYTRNDKTYPRLKNSIFSEGYFYGTNHRTGTYGNNILGNEITGFDNLGNFAIKNFTEVGLHDCKSGSANCKHPTWLYFVDLVSNHIAQSTAPLSYISVKGSVTQNGTIPTLPYFVQVYAGSDKIGESMVIENSSNFELEVEFKPNTPYHVQIVPNPLSTLRSTNTETLETSETKDESSLQFSNVELVNTEISEGDLGVFLKDGTTGQTLTNFDIKVFNYLGEPVLSQYVDSSSTTIRLPMGNYTVKATKAGYLEGAAKACNVVANQTNLCEVSLIPIGHVAEGSLSAVLTWDVNPRDLDSHLVKYDSSGNQIYHIYYSHKTDSTSGDNLDVDDTSSYGPETVTVQNIDNSSRYIYAVYHYSGSGTITSTSDATVNVQTENTSRTYNAPTAGTGRWWKVFEIVNGRIIPCQSGCILDDSDTVFSARAARSYKGSSAEQLPYWLLDIKNNMIKK